MKKSEITARKASVLNLVKLVKYQQGTIVSGTILEGKSGNITVFAFDKGQKLSEHTAPFDALAEVLEGKAEIRISGRPFTLKRGNMIIMPANKPHSVTAAERFKMLLVMLRT